VVAAVAGGQPDLWWCGVGTISLSLPGIYFLTLYLDPETHQCQQVPLSLSLSLSLSLQPALYSTSATGITPLYSISLWPHTGLWICHVQLKKSALCLVDKKQQKVKRLFDVIVPLRDELLSH
jgi:hypothetical protein